MTGRLTFARALLAVTLLGATFRLFGVVSQPPLTDELDMGRTATAYVERGSTYPSMPHHPNLRNLLLAASLRSLGSGPVGLRAVSLLLGILSVPLLGALVRRLAASDAAGALAAFLLAIDPLHITFSRQAIQEVHVLFFALLGTLLAVLSLSAESRERDARRARIPLLIAAGVAFGLAIASKYQALFPLLACLFLTVRDALRRRAPAGALLAVTALVALPISILVLSDLPWFARGYDLADWLFMRRAVFLRMTSKYLPVYTETNTDVAAWRWFIVPLQGYASFSAGPGGTVLAVGMANPLTWLLVLPSSLFVALRRTARPRSAVLQLLFWSSYLPFVFTSRPIFFLTALATTPFALGLVAVALEEVALPTRGRWLVPFLAAALGVSILMFPLSAGTALEHSLTSRIAARFNPHP